MPTFINSFWFAAPAGGYGSHQYWRFYIDSGATSGTDLVVIDLQFRTSPGGGQAATGGTAFAGGNGADALGTVPSDAFTGSGYRRSAKSGWWIGYEFASATPIVEMYFTTSTNSDLVPFTGKLQYSDDGVNYSDAFTYFDPVAPVNTSQTWPQDLSGASGYKAFRFVWTLTGTTNRTVMGEFEIRKASVDYTRPTAVSSAQLITPPNLVDNDTATSASSLTVNAGTAIMSTSEPIQPDDYRINSGGNFARTPTAFTLEGSNDGTNWTLLDTQSGVTWSSNQQWQTFTV